MAFLPIPDKKMKIGDLVGVKSSVVLPKYKWGDVNHSNVGMVTFISPDEQECKVDFFSQKGWTALVEEMEVIESAHIGVR